MSAARPVVRIHFPRGVKGWRKPPGARLVTRATRWGTPHLIGPCPVCHAEHDRDAAVAAFEADLTPARVAELRTGLAGATAVMCSCSLDLPCHGDVIVRILNGGESR